METDFRIDTNVLRSQYYNIINQCRRLKCPVDPQLTMNEFLLYINTELLPDFTVFVREKFGVEDIGPFSTISLKDKTFGFVKENLIMTVKRVRTSTYETRKRKGIRATMIALRKEKRKLESDQNSNSAR